MKRKVKFLCGTGLAVAIAASFVGFKSSFTSLTSGTEGSDCDWHHYNGVESTYLENGSNEYWVCCKHHEMVIEEPTVGSITESGTPSAEFVSELDSEDIRYSPIKTSDHVAAIKVNHIQTATGKFTFATRNAFSSIESLTFDAKWENATTISWLSFGHATDITTADNYTNMTNFAVDNDGEWHSITIEFSCGVAPEYLFFQAAQGEFDNNATLLFRNIVITYDDGEQAVEPLNAIGTYFRSYYNSDYPDLNDSALSYTTRGENGSDENRALKIEPNKLNTGAGQINLVTTNKFRGLKTMTIRYKAEGGVLEGQGGWCRFALADDLSGLDIYSCFSKPNLVFTPIYDGEWHTVSIENDSGPSGYVYFCAAVNEFTEGTTFYFDTIEFNSYWNNCKATETFNHDCSYFKSGSEIRNGVWTTVPVVE